MQPHLISEREARQRQRDLIATAVRARLSRLARQAGSGPDERRHPSRWDPPPRSPAA